MILLAVGRAAGTLRYRHGYLSILGVREQFSRGDHDITAI